MIKDYVPYSCSHSANVSCGEVKGTWRIFLHILWHQSESWSFRESSSHPIIGAGLGPGGSLFRRNISPRYAIQPKAMTIEACSHRDRGREEINTLNIFGTKCKFARVLYTPDRGVCVVFSWRADILWRIPLVLIFPLLGIN